MGAVCRMSTRGRQRSRLPPRDASHGRWRSKIPTSSQIITLPFKLVQVQCRTFPCGFVSSNKKGQSSHKKRFPLRQRNAGPCQKNSRKKRLTTTSESKGQSWHFTPCFWLPCVQHLKRKTGINATPGATFTRQIHLWWANVLLDV